MVNMRMLFEKVDRTRAVARKAKIPIRVLKSSLKPVTFTKFIFFSSYLQFFQEQTSLMILEKKNLLTKKNRKNISKSAQEIKKK